MKPASRASTAHRGCESRNKGTHPPLPRVSAAGKRQQKQAKETKACHKNRPRGLASRRRRTYVEPPPPPPPPLPRSPLERSLKPTTLATAPPRPPPPNDLPLDAAAFRREPPRRLEPLAAARDGRARSPRSPPCPAEPLAIKRSPKLQLILLSQYLRRRHSAVGKPIPERLSTDASSGSSPPSGNQPRAQETTIKSSTIATTTDVAQALNNP